MPQDLYIPPDALEVILEAFEGPLDLLLYLIRRQNLDILDIPVAEITRQYVDYIEVLQDLRFELAAEYLVMAAILAEIKSRMLLPRADAGGRRRRPIRAPNWFAACRNTSASSRRPKTSTPCPAWTATPRRRRPSCPERATVKLPPPVDLREMLLALRDVLKRADLFTHHAITRERAVSVRQRMGEVLGRLADGSVPPLRDPVQAEEGSSAWW